jgi:pimeloyl-ACP methyl ester carboxylesterase
MKAVVLVHGAWSDATVWSQVAQSLLASGHQVAAPDMPSHGLDTTPATDATMDGYVDAVIASAKTLEGPVVLVGHSMAGTVISMVAEREPELASHLIYLAAFMLPDGQSLYGFTQTSPGMADSALGPALRPGEGVLGVDPASFIDVFCADAPAELAATRSARTVGNADRYHRREVGHGAAYVHLNDKRSVRQPWLTAGNDRRNRRGQGRLDRDVTSGDAVSAGRTRLADRVAHRVSQALLSLFNTPERTHPQATRLHTKGIHHVCHR